MNNLEKLIEKADIISYQIESELDFCSRHNPDKETMYILMSASEQLVSIYREIRKKILSNNKNKNEPKI